MPIRIHPATVMCGEDAAAAAAWVVVWYGVVSIGTLLRLRNATSGFHIFVQDIKFVVVAVLN